MRTIGQTITVRLDPSTREQLQAYMNANDLTPSQAVRTLLATGLGGDASIKLSAIREAILPEVARIKRNLATCLHEALKEIGE